MPNEKQPINEKPKGNIMQNENGPEDETPSAPGSEIEQEKKKDSDKHHEAPTPPLKNQQH